MSDVFSIQVAPGRIIKVQASTPEEAAAGARKVLENESRGTSDGMAKSFGQGLTLGFGDELAASVRSALPQFSNWMMQGPALQRDESIGGSPTPQTVSTAPTYGARYEEELAKERQQLKDFEAQNPKLALGSEIAGNVVSGVAASALPGVGALFRGGGSIPANIGKGAVGGAMLGGAQGFGQGEGGFDKRMGSAGIGAAIGGATGAALPLVAKGASIAYEKATPAILNKIADVADRYAPKVTPKSLSAATTGESIPRESLLATIAEKARAGVGNVEEDAAIKRLAKAVASSGGVDRARGKLASLGEDAFIADVGKGTERLANVGYLTSDDAADKYIAAYGARERGTGRRFLKSMGGEAEVPSIYDARRFLDANRKYVGETAYGVMDEAGLKQTPRLREMYENPEVKAAITSVMNKESLSRIGMSRAPASPVEIMHEVKRAIQNIGIDPNGRPAPGAKWWQDASDEFVRELKRANPALADADRAYQEAISLYNKKSGEGWLTRGTDFLKSGYGDAAVNVSPSALAAELPGATPRQLQAFRVGSSNVMRDAATSGPESTRRLAKVISNNEIMQQKLTEIYGPERAAEMMKRSMAELEYAAAKNRITAGSPTAERSVALARETGLGPVPTSGGDILGIWRAAMDALAKTDKASEPVRSRLADLLANPNREMNAETLSLVEALLKRQALPRPTAGLSAGAAGAVSNP